MQERAKRLIPGKTQLLSKRPEMFAPGVWPGYYSKAKGQEIWDLDGNRYFDFSIAGIGANILGYADKYVNKKIVRAIQLGSSSSLNCSEEIELAEKLIELHPWAEMFRYTRSGGEAVAVAIRIARASTGRDKILFCGYHGWHDWYLSSNLKNRGNLDSHLLPGLSPNGVPENLNGLSIPFLYNDFESLSKALQENSLDVAAIIMEPTNSQLPKDNFLQKVRDEATKRGIVLIFDEISSGFRINAGGIHRHFNINPDIAIFSKAISNGFPMGVVMGRRDVMESAQDTFISSTTWTERIGPTAAIATIEKFVRDSVHKKLIEIGDGVRSAWVQAANAADLEVQIEGLPSMSRFVFKHTKDREMRTFFTQEMLEKGFLASGRFYAMNTHTKYSLGKYVDSCHEVFQKIRNLLDGDLLELSLKGEVLHSGFSRIN